MKSGKYKSPKKEASGRKGKISSSKRRMMERAEKWKPNASQGLCEAYITKIEWVQRAIPKFRKEVAT
jgi:hypothetical protein